MHTVSVKIEWNKLIKKYNVIIIDTLLFYIRVQVGRVLQLLLAKQVTVADPDIVYPLVQL